MLGEKIAGVYRGAVLGHLEVEMVGQAALRNGGVAYTAQDGAGGNGVSDLHGGDRSQIGIDAGHTGAVVQIDGGAHQVVLHHVDNGASGGRHHLGARGGGDVQPAVGAPVSHGGVIGQGLHAEFRENLTLKRPGKHRRGDHRRGAGGGFRRGRGGGCGDRGGLRRGENGGRGAHLGGAGVIRGVGVTVTWAVPATGSSGPVRDPIAEKR